MTRLLIALLLLQINYVTAQDCGTLSPYEHTERYTEEELAKRDEAEEKLLKQMHKGIRGERAGVITIPTVVHIIHLGEPIGTGTNLTVDQVENVISLINEGLSQVDGGNDVDLQVELCLAKRDPNGNFTNGIVRANGLGVPEYGNTGISYACFPYNDSEVKSLSKWPHDKYLNIWVVRDICSPSGTILGYANYPWALTTDEDGIVVRASSFLDIETPIHELGHIMGLMHTFEGDNDGLSCPSNSDCTMQGDRCCDTEPSVRFVCTANSCANTSAWDDTRFNYMSYCNNTSRFTAAQKYRTDFYLTDNITDLYKLGLSNTCLASTQLPNIQYSSHTIDDDNNISAGNENGLAEAGETVEIDVEIYNAGPGDAEAISATLSTTDAYINILDSTRPYGDLYAEDYRFSPSFKFRVSPTCPDKDVTFTLSATSVEGSWVDTFTVHVYAPTGIRPLHDLYATIYPNPNKGHFTLSLGSMQQGEISFAIYNAIGQEVAIDKPAVIKYGNMDINLQTAPAGLYIFQLKAANGAICTQRFCVE